MSDRDQSEMGPGRFDDLCTYVMQETKAEAVIVVVYGGERESGYDVQVKRSVAALPQHLLLLVEGLRNAASALEARAYSIARRSVVPIIPRRRDDE